jgi:rubredoxin
MTTRDNSARFQAPDLNVSPENNSPQQNMGALQYVVPTELVELPTRGLFYPEGHPLCKKQEIEIKTMTAKEEDLLVNKSLLQKGVALDRVLQSIIVDPAIRLEDLFIGDKNAIIVAARISAYGEEYKVNVSCPDCAVSQKYSFDLQENTIRYIDDIDVEGVTLTEKGTFRLVLPRSQAVIETRLICGHDEKKLLGKGKKAEPSLTEQFRTFVTAVNNVEDKNLVNQFIDVMPAFDSKYLRETYSKIIPNIDLTQHFECNNCGYSQDMEVPFTVEFFWPRP